MPGSTEVTGSSSIRGTTCAH